MGNVTERLFADIYRQRSGLNGRYNGLLRAKFFLDHIDMYLLTNDSY